MIRQPPELIILLGAAVRSDGRPSAALARRIREAARAAKTHPGAQLFCSGGVGRHGPSEAAVMAAELVRLGVARRRLSLDEDSLDTLQTAVAARRHMARRTMSRCLVVSDSYHVARAAALMRLLGVQASTWPARAGLREMGPKAFLWMRLREAVATPYDLILALIKHRTIPKG